VSPDEDVGTTCSTGALSLALGTTWFRDIEIVAGQTTRLALDALP
jgi:hypothetical protein